jgi:two-component system cell cycle response regulator
VWVHEVSLEQAEHMLREDARAALTSARRWLDGQDADTQSVPYQRWLLIKGAAQARLGETEDGARILREVNAWAQANGSDELLAVSHRRLSALFRRIGDPALMLEHAVRAVELLDDDADLALRADHLVGLADALGANGSYSAAIARYQEAAKLTAECCDGYLQHAILNNLAYTQYEAGLLSEAVETVERLRARVEGGGGDYFSHDVDTIARVYAAAGRYQEAAAIIEPHWAELDDRGEDCDGQVVVLLSLTSVRRMAGDPEGAQRALDRAFLLIEEYALTGLRIEAMREQAELYAAQGRYQEAYETFVDFHEADVELRAAERDARAHTLNAIFEATEARRSSDHFRELSVRDPLTGLHNRRHLDERLQELLDPAQPSHPQLVVGIVDLDHFKRINDTRSHAVGDEVLRQVARILQDQAEQVEGGIAVRMGGEEFLVLFPDLDRASGIARMERIRDEIASHPWSAVTDGLKVTASVGVASSPEDGVERRELLELADRNLYRAKEFGRDQVVV